MLAPTSGLLFCVIRDDDYKKVNRKKDEIIALDAQTLQLRHRFGLGLLDDASQPAVVGDELYVCDTNNDRLQVFSLTGEHRRSVTGAWRSPEQLCFAKGRLYLVEQVLHIDVHDSISRRIESGELKCDESEYFAKETNADGGLARGDGRTVSEVIIVGWLAVRPLVGGWQG